VGAEHDLERDGVAVVDTRETSECVVNAARAIGLRSSRARGSATVGVAGETTAPIA
jgi:hypothetical protein